MIKNYERIVLMLAGIGAWELTKIVLDYFIK
jgi:hypothetical protein